MLPIARPKTTLRPAPLAYRVAPAARPRADGSVAQRESLAAPLTLAAIVACALLLAIVTALLGALGA